MKPLLGLLSYRLSYKVTPSKIEDFLRTKAPCERFNAVFSAPETVRAAAVQLARREYTDCRTYVDELYNAARAAVDDGAQVVVYPEYVGLAALTMAPGWRGVLQWIFHGRAPHSALSGPAPDPERLAAVFDTFEGFLDEVYNCTFSGIAKLLHVYVVAGSTLVREDDRLYNRCTVFGPDGAPVGYQDKVCAVGADRALCVSPADLIEPIETPMGPLGVVLGSDAYYFECFKILREKGARLIAVPGTGNSVAGDLLRCRAEENGVYLLYACYANPEGATDPVRAGIFAPADLTPDRGGLLAGPQDARAGAVSARVNLAKLLPPIDTGAPNPRFLAGDYLRSYRYCGALPLVEPIEDGESESD